MAAGEGDETGQLVGVGRDLDLWSVLAAGAQRLVHALHPGEQGVDLGGVEGDLEPGGRRDVPGVHEDVAEEERPDRRVVTARRDRG